mmetsp:Transcript_102513/g.287333  ORF Transcript_102513/g.287333 Transcript_102513/m.287333 type:complete len:112 (+) Transcript_102513:580-915(+)
MLITVVVCPYHGLRLSINPPSCGRLIVYQNKNDKKSRTIFEAKEISQKYIYSFMDHRLDIVVVLKIRTSVLVFVIVTARLLVLIGGHLTGGCCRAGYFLRFHTGGSNVRLG